MRFFCIMLLAMSFTFGKNLGEHSDDMWAIFPFDESAHNEENYGVQEFYKEVSAFIDYCEYPKKGNTRGCSHLQKLFKELKYKEIDDNCNWDNHRIWFHWGFSNLSKSSSEFERKIEAPRCNLAIKNSHIDVKREIDNLFEKRKNHLMEQWNVTFNTPKCQSLSKEKKEAFVSLLYSIHILGDYTTPQQLELQQMADLYKSIRNDILTIGGSSAVATEFIKQLGLDDTSSPSVSELLNNLRKGFTPFMYDLAKEGPDCDYISIFGERYKLKTLE